MTASAEVEARPDHRIFMSILRDAAITAVVALVLAIAIVGLRTVDRGGRLVIEPRIVDVLIGIGILVLGRIGLQLASRGWPAPAITGGVILVALGFALPFDSDFLRWFAVMAGGVVALRSVWLIARPLGVTEVGKQAAGGIARITPFIGIILLVIAIALPLLPTTDQRVLDLGILVITYIMLGWGLNIVVGLAGLLDLGYVAFYAVGAYSFALLAQNFDLGFWACLPLAGGLAAMFGLLLGFPVLRLRGDYLAIVTLGFGEIIRIILLNWYEFTGGPGGLSNVPGPTFFGYRFVAEPEEGEVAFHQLLGIDFAAEHRLAFLYYIVLVLALITNLFTLRIRRLPVGRAWEALREDEIACKALGINPTNTKLTAFALGAMFGGFAGSFFAAKQNFISPESFTFIESAIILAIVVLGGMGNQLGVVFAAILLIGLPEWFRDLQSFRMLAFGGAMVLIMVWRPRGIVSARRPTILLNPPKRSGAS
jgi:branched-chain amino acid transport system permease protein